MLKKDVVEFRSALKSKDTSRDRLLIEQGDHSLEIMSWKEVQAFYISNIEFDGMVPWNIKGKIIELSESSTNSVLVKINRKKLVLIERVNFVPPDKFSDYTVIGELVAQF